MISIRFFSGFPFLRTGDCARNLRGWRTGFVSCGDAARVSPRSLVPLAILACGIVMTTSAVAQIPSQVTIDPPSAAAGIYEAVSASFGPAPTVGGINGSIVLVDDGTASPTLGCDPLVGFPAGAIALIDRGDCSFIQKVSGAQAAGAVAAIVVNNVAGDPIAMGGSDPSITIPSVMVSQADGAVIKAGLPATGTVSRTPLDADLSITKSAVFDDVNVIFTLTVANAGPDEAWDVVVTDFLPAGLDYVSDDCGGSNVPPWTWNIGILPVDAEASCNITTLPAFEGTFTNTATVTSFAQDPVPDNDTDEVMVVVDFPDPRATFAVEKVFTDGNPGPVGVTIDCNTGLPLMQTASISEGDGVTFVVVDYNEGEMDCSVSETVPEGYSQSYLAGGDSNPAADDEACLFTAVEFEDANSCDITNALEPVEVIVHKEWIDEHPEHQLPTFVNITLRCENAEIVNGFSCGNDACSEQFIGPGNPGAFLVFPDWNGSTACSATEVPEVGVLQDVSDCGSMPLAPGEGDECTIVNTRLFAGIPTLGQYGLAVLALLMLGMGLAGVRRFT